MGGFVPLGYDIRDRKLIVNETEAKTVRNVFERFARCGSATALVRELATKKVVNKYGNGRYAGGGQSRRQDVDYSCRPHQRRH